MIWGGPAHRVLPAGEVSAEGAGGSGGADQGLDRGATLLWLPHCGRTVGHEQKHGAADLPVAGLAGAQTGRRAATQDRSLALGGDGPGPALGHGPVPGLGRPRPVADVGPGDRLPYPALSRSAKSKTAEAALEQALIARFGALGRVRTPFLLRSDNGLVFTRRSYTRLVRSYGLRQAFITPHCPQQNGMVERRALKEPCVHRHRFENQQHASRVIGDWIQFYNHRRPHQALGMKTPAEAYALVA